MTRRVHAGHLVIMARAPRLGAVKRRLARDIGDLGALGFYRATLRRVVRTLGHDRRWTTSLALTPDRLARPGRALRRARCRVLAQGGGDLGARLARLLRAPPAGPVVIVGSDIPDLGAFQISQALRALGRHDWVFGPAGDGGYWLIGAARRRALPRDPFAGVRWSSARALADTRVNLKGASIATLEVLDDIDTGADLARHSRPRRAGTTYTSRAGNSSSKR